MAREKTMFGLPAQEVSPIGPERPPEGFSMTLFCYLTAYLPKLRGLSLETLEEIARQCGEVSAANALHVMPDPEFSIPAWSAEKLRGGQVIALMIGCIWIYLREDETAAEWLWEYWEPLRMAVVMEGKAGNG